MHNFGWAKIGVFCAKGDPYAPAYREVFDHAGLRVEYLEEVSAREISRFHVIALCGRGKLNHPESVSVNEWIKKGNTLICSGSAWGLDSLLGLQAESHHLSSGTLTPAKPDKLWPEGAEHARFFGGEAKKAAHCEVLAKIGDAVGIGRRKVSKATAIYLAPHVGQTLQLMQYGRSVECDGVGPSDGSATLDNGILTAEDGAVLDFEGDRCKVEGCDTPFFGYPHSDVVREVLLRAIIQSVDARGLSVPLLWHWPNNARAAAILTIDCEEFEREHVNQLHRMLAMFGTPAAWLVGLPGYSLDVYRAMRAWEHEIGMLFMTDDHAGWHEEKFKIQLTAISRLTGQAHLMCARANEGRWKGWKNFYDLCEPAGARISLSKGGRQPGTSGFLFGTSHPFVPRHRDGSPYLVTEIPYTVFHPGKVTPDPVAEKIVYQTAYRHGCFHLVCPSDAIRSQETGASLRRVLSICKQQKMEFLVPEVVHRFERGRRQLRMVHKLLDNEGTLLITSDVALQGLTVLINGPRLSAEHRGKELNVDIVERYGCKFNAIQLQVEAKIQAELRIWPTSVASVAA